MFGPGRVSVLAEWRFLSPGWIQSLDQTRQDRGGSATR